MPETRSNGRGVRSFPVFIQTEIKFVRNILWEPFVIGTNRLSSPEPRKFPLSRIRDHYYVNENFMIIIQLVHFPPSPHRITSENIEVITSNQGHGNLQKMLFQLSMYIGNWHCEVEVLWEYYVYC